MKQKTELQQGIKMKSKVKIEEQKPHKTKVQVPNYNNANNRRGLTVIDIALNKTDLL